MAMSSGFPALLIRVSNEAMQAYLQQYPLASGPDETMNERCVEEVRHSFEIRLSAECADVVQLTPPECELSIAALQRFLELARRVSLGSGPTAVVLNDLGWKVNRLPPEARDVLSIGCGDGIELLFLRAVLPEARITAYDWKDKLLPGIGTAADVTYREVNFVEFLAGSSEQYDVIFSNHVLEHMYDPARILRVLFDRLRPGGILISALPLDGMKDVPFVDDLLAIAKAPDRLHPLDMQWVAAGHPWKTNPSDLHATLCASGFRQCQMLQRENHRSRHFAGSPASYKKHRDVRLRAFRILFGSLNRVAKRIALRPSPAFVRLWFAVQSRSAIGISRLRNEFSDEVLLVARRPTR